ncbi:glycosyltransferase family 4 protein [Candidatus Parcubacteria bacterium]|nr:glycosyltransferase family 4 protein [Patescibacteria group bacterium]MBU4309248.1 glycosyltransferase family 4 protein [Patescibacteria group bacterium]MBU4432477.1 glycosyltransferase family 4 protein [Patescibacteria group bacterium]MBU4577609.1 glycosyltransferase family 4 protein [Patescibacteria group bacterium]MCG2697296.1 glycosyltransferase family 4 protein [Candidatus Parcubacteria bacterium]
MLIQLSLQKKGAGVIDSFELSSALVDLEIKHSVFLSRENELADKWNKEESIYRSIVWCDTYKSTVGDFVKWTFLASRWFFVIRQINYLKAKNIVATHFHPWLFFVVLAKRIIGFNFIYVVHENPFLPKERDNYIMVFLQKFILKHADKIIVHSEFMKKNLQEFFPEDRVKHLPLGSYQFYNRRTPIKYPPAGVTFLFLGRIEKYKGLEVLLEAFTGVKKQFSDAKLIVAGQGNINTEQIKAMNTLGVEIYNQWLTDEQIMNFLNKADVMVLPYTKASQSGVVSMSLGFGLPIIVSSLTGLAEQVIEGDNGLLAKPGDGDSLLEKMVYLCANPSRIEEMGKRAKFYGDNVFTWKKVAEGLVEFMS